MSEQRDGARERLTSQEVVDDDPTSPSGQHAPRSLRSASPMSSGLSEEFSDPSDPMIGRTIGGRYKVQQRIGRGGMGLVYRAKQIGLERDVVIKVLAAEALDTDTAQERFMREAQALSMLNHPNIVAIYDFGQESYQSYIVMEYVDGTRLDTLIKRNTHLPLEVFTPIARQMLEALGDAHEMGLMHRDLKPSNILLTSKREFPYYVKVLDFGLAKMLEDESDLTGQHNLVGSLAYLSPEQILGHDIDQRVDVYALGVLFYYMLSGSKPFMGNDTTVLYKHIHSEVPPLHERLPEGHGVPAALAALVERCLAKDPADRPAHADELLDELLHALAGRDVLATPWVTGEYSTGSYRVVREDNGVRSENLIFASPDTGETSNGLSRQSVGHLSSSSLSMPSRPVIDEDSQISIVTPAISGDLLDSAISSVAIPAPIPAASSSPSLTPPPNKARGVMFVAFAAIFGAIAAFGIMGWFAAPQPAPDEIALEPPAVERAVEAEAPRDDSTPSPEPSAEVAPSDPDPSATDDPAAEPDEPTDDPVVALDPEPDRSSSKTRKASTRTRKRRTRPSKPERVAASATSKPDPDSPTPDVGTPDTATKPRAPQDPQPANTTPKKKGDPDGIMLDAPAKTRKPKKKTKSGNEFDLVDM